MNWRDLQRNLRDLLNQWDPTGVADTAPDEYDYMLGPLLTKLRAGAGRAEIGEFLWQELEDHFGLDPARYHVDSVATLLVGWWASAVRDSRRPRQAPGSPARSVPWKWP